MGRAIGTGERVAVRGEENQQEIESDDHLGGRVMWDR